MSEFNLFVYGTLRAGGDNGHNARAETAGAASRADAAIPDARAGAASGLLAGCVKVGDGTIGGTLYDIEGRYPALVHYGADPVQGEIWRCPAEVLPALDAYEGIGVGLFRRVATEIETQGGERLPCWLYTAGPALARHLTPANRVASGVWRARRA